MIKKQYLYLIATLLSFLIISCEKKFDSVIDFQNVPPVISNLMAPDSLVVGTDTLVIQFSVDVNDPDGIENISAVWFNSYRPDGSPTSGNPYYMYDDGDEKFSGDEIKGDKRYTRRVILPPGTSPGRRKFEFMAQDKSGELSNIIIHYILVKQ